MKNLPTYEEWKEEKKDENLSEHEMKSLYWQEVGSLRPTRRGFGSDCTRGRRMDLMGYN